MKRWIAAGAILGAAVILISRDEPRRVVGPQSDGSVLLNSGWSIRPAGRQLELDTFPMSSVLSPDGKYLIVLNQGYNPPSLSVIDAKAEKELSRTPVPDGWLGLVLTKDGRKLYVGGGSKAAVFEFDFSAEGTLSAARTFEVVPEAKRAHTDFIGDLAFTPDGRMLYAADLFQDQVLVINPQSGRVIEKFKTGRRPYRLLFHPDGKSYFVTSWADGTLYHHETETGRVMNRLRLGPHTTDMLWRDKAPAPEEGEQSPYAARLFVTASNTNKVYSVGIDSNKELKQLEVINVSMTAMQPNGMTPSALAMSQDQKTLFVVCSDANAVAVADVTESRTRVLGFVPTGWYPTAARMLADGRLFIMNGRGPRSYPNPKGPNPSVRPSPVHGGVQAVQYVGRIQKGSVSVVDAFDQEKLDAYTTTVFANTPYRDRLLEQLEIPEGNPIPRRPGDPSPIEHVLYIVKENRTYDQVLGDLEKGNGDPSLCLFPEKVSPNHHKLAREFVLLDNFYVSADVSADGHNWTTAAIAPDYVQKMWPNSYAGRRRHYDYEGSDPTSLPPSGYIWTQVLAAGLSMRNYGYFADNLPPAEVKADGIQVRRVRDPQLAPVTNMRYRAFDMEYLDADRAQVFLDDLKHMEQAGTMPRFLILRLGNDHTSGVSPGKYAPLAAMADNDAALGMIIEACSRSRFWQRMAIFVLEDDAQNGPDHVDSHRSPAYVISPYTRRGGLADSTMYNTTSMLRTMELILGLRPMTTFDAAATVMWQPFSAKADPAPYEAEKARIDIRERNPQPTAATRELVARSLEQDFEEADRIDDDVMNDVLWRALRGTDPPAPTRSFFSR
jgi:YVTN family beta-propeller protein